MRFFITFVLLLFAGFGFFFIADSSYADPQLCETHKVSGKPELLDIKCRAYSIQLNCQRHAANYATLKLDDSLDKTRRLENDKFFYDSNIPPNCQQKGNIARMSYGNGYDRGKLVAVNYMNNSSQDMLQTFFTFNILPQITSINRYYYWHDTEWLTQHCYRHKGNLRVFAGVLWDEEFLSEDSKKRHHYFNSEFNKNFGIEIPTAFWKVVVFDKAVMFGGQRVKSVAWIIPNIDLPKPIIKNRARRLDEYLVTSTIVKDKVDYSLPLPADVGPQANSTPSCPFG